MAEGMTADQWRSAANAIREIAAEWDRKAETAAASSCGVILPSATPTGDPVACAYFTDHDGPHSWASLPTYTMHGTRS